MREELEKEKHNEEAYADLVDKALEMDPLQFMGQDKAKALESSEPMAVA